MLLVNAKSTHTQSAAQRRFCLNMVSEMIFWSLNLVHRSTFFQKSVKNHRIAQCPPLSPDPQVRPGLNFGSLETRDAKSISSIKNERIGLSISGPRPHESVVRCSREGYREVLRCVQNRPFHYLTPLRKSSKSMSGCQHQISWIWPGGSKYTISILNSFTKRTLKPLWASKARFLESGQVAPDRAFPFSIHLEFKV